MSDIIYKIKNLNSGLFSTGGYEPKFTKKGKIWKQKNHLTAHLSLLAGSKGNGHVYDNCVVLQLEVVEVEEPILVHEFNQENEQRRLQREANRKARYLKAQKETRRLQYEHLKREFGSDT